MIIVLIFCSFQMEERAVGGKEKKYVLYTVVNDDKSKAGFGVWVVRILLGSLLLVALAVVPYVSLRLAQTNDRTLVVFQPVPIHNHTRIHHHKVTSHRPVSFPSKIQSDSLVKDNYTTEAPNSQSKGNATLVMLHESAVTLSLLEEFSNISHPSKNQSGETSSESPETTVASGSTTTLNSTNDNPKENTSEPEKDSSVLLTNDNTSTPQPAEDVPQALISASSLKSEESSTSSSIHENKNSSINQNTSTEKTVKNKSKLLQILSPSISVATTLASSVSHPTSNAPLTTSRTSKYTSPGSTPRSDIVHKLAYVATASSGNHVGGICVWKTNKNITKWSYFYDNIPIEFQSHQDSTDHEMRALLAAVRLWQDQWHDYHVVLRSQHQSIQGSKHPTRVELGKELESLSDKHFTYEPEWRQRKDDSLMEIAYCLARLHKDYTYWFSKFEQHVDEMLGAQDWSKAQEDKRQQVPQSLFFTEQKPQNESQTGDLTSLSIE